MNGVLLFSPIRIEFWTFFHVAWLSISARASTTTKGAFFIPFQLEIWKKFAKMKNSIKTRTNKCWRRFEIGKIPPVDERWELKQMYRVDGIEESKERILNASQLHSPLRVEKRLSDGVFWLQLYNFSVCDLIYFPVIGYENIQKQQRQLKMLFWEINILRSVSFFCAKESVKSS